MSRPIEELKNLGEKSASWLRGLGINSIEDLEAFDPIKAYCLLKASDPRMSRNMLHAMIAGIMDLHYTELPQEIKEQLDVKVDSYMEELTQN